MRKRSTHVALALMGATAAFGLSGCKSEETDARAFPDEASCLASVEQGNLFYTADDCRAAFAQAKADHAETAPRYDSLQVCEEQHGEGNCGTEAAQGAGGSGSIFMPLLMGYMIGSMLGGRGVMSQPLMRTGTGGFATPGGTALATNNGTGKMGTGVFAKAPVTAGQPPMTRATVAQRGGFGQTATTRSTGTRSVGG